MTGRSRIVVVLIAVPIVVTGGWFLFTSWQYRGFTWMYTAPAAVHVKDNRYVVTEDSPVRSLGSDRCDGIDTIPVARKPVYFCHGDKPSYVAVEWQPDEFYVYRNHGPGRFWDMSGW